MKNNLIHMSTTWLLVAQIHFRVTTFELRTVSADVDRFVSLDSGNQLATINGGMNPAVEYDIAGIYYLPSLWNKKAKTI